MQRCKNDINKDLILLLLKENNEFKNIILEQQNKLFTQQNIVLELAKNSLSNNTSNNNSPNISDINNSQIMSNNKTFNLHFFLNETCKNAMNLSEFIDSIKLQLSDLINVGEVGYIQGISNIIINKLNALDIIERPIHCTDKKREVLCIKEQGKWEKEDNKKINLRKLIKDVSFKNIDLLPQFREKYPEYKNSQNLISDQYNKLVMEAMGGRGDNKLQKEDKIIKKIAKSTIIFK